MKEGREPEKPCVQLPGLGQYQYHTVIQSNQVVFFILPIFDLRHVEDRLRLRRTEVEIEFATRNKKFRKMKSFPTLIHKKTIPPSPSVGIQAYDYKLFCEKTDGKILIQPSSFQVGL